MGPLNSLIWNIYVITSLAFVLGLGFFYKGVLYDDHLSKTTTFEWSQEWLGYTGLTVSPFINILKKY